MILGLKVLLSQYFCVPEDLISRENCNKDGVLQTYSGKGASQPHCDVLVHTSINPEPFCSSPGTISWPWLLQSKIKLRKEGAGCPYHCCNWANNPKYLYSWSQEQSCFWSRETSLAQKQLRREVFCFICSWFGAKRKQLAVLENSEKFEVTKNLLWIQVLFGSACLCSAELWSLQVDPKSTAIGLWSGKMYIESSKTVVVTGAWKNEVKMCAVSIKKGISLSHWRTCHFPLVPPRYELVSKE